ncbi:MAG TPA: Nramp family divalent metal transporter [Pseudomonadales bacterium]|nr:Nramp family divalent metal transporter [Pseudomonadales bacterium]
MRRFGPGLMVTAAFIGPGTLTTASLAGAGYGLALLWGLLFSIATTLVLQEMAARLGIVGRRGLADALREGLRPGLARTLVLALIVAAIGVGNAAYEAGNLVGAALGASALLGGSVPAFALAIAALAALLLAFGTYRLIERALVALVALMSTVFLVTLLMAPPSMELLGTIRWPWELPPGSLLTVLALIGTTVVPYNLFLHASAVQARWSEDVAVADALRESRWDAGLSIGLGGLVTLAIMSTAAVAFFGTGAEVRAADLARQLEPLLGPWAGLCFAIGLLAAGVTSAITAPLAAAWAVAGACGWQGGLADPRARAVWLAVLATGALFAALQTRPLVAILFAQAANGLLLPVIAAVLLWVMNRGDLLGEFRNGVRANLLGGLILLVTVVLGGRNLLLVFERLFAG